MKNLKDRPTQFRLNESERCFLEKKGLGSMAHGLKRLMIEAGYEEFLKSYLEENAKIEEVNAEEK